MNIPYTSIPSMNIPSTSIPYTSIPSMNIPSISIPSMNNQVKFTLFNKNNYNYCADVDADANANAEIECQHVDTKNVNGQITCLDCGIILGGLNTNPEWRYYYQEDNRHDSNPSRCHLRKSNTDDVEKSILSDIIAFDFPDIIKVKSDEIYQYHILNSDKKTYRNKCRKGLVFAVVSLALELNNNIVNPDLLCKKLGIKKKEASSGKKEIERTCFKKYIYNNALNFKNIQIYDLIPDFLKILNFEKYTSEANVLLLNIKNYLKELYWSMEQLKLALDCKNIDYSPYPTLNKEQSMYLLNEYFLHYKDIDTEPVHPLDPFPTVTDFKLKESALFKTSFKQSIAIGLLYYCLIRDGWIGFSFQKSIIYWFNINKPYYVNNNGAIYIEKKIAIFIPKNENLSYFQILNKIKFISKNDVQTFVDDVNMVNNVTAKLMDNYGTVYVVNKKQFSQIVGFSDITINRIACEVDKICKTNLMATKKQIVKSKNKAL